MVTEFFFTAHDFFSWKVDIINIYWSNVNIAGYLVCFRSPYYVYLGLLGSHLHLFDPVPVVWGYQIRILYVPYLPVLPK